MFLPNGETLRHLMESYVRETQEKYGYQHVWTSHLGKVKLYKTSKHWYNYRQDMFPVMQGEQELSEDDAYVLKPMNCFFFQAEDGIRDWSVTGVQTCALPI